MRKLLYLGALTSLLVSGPGFAKEKTGWLYLQRYLSDAQLRVNKGIAVAPFWFFDEKGAAVPSKAPDSSHGTGELVEVPEGTYYAVAGQRNVGLTRTKYQVVAGKVTVVQTGFVQVSTWKAEDLPKLECSPWDAEMTAFARVPDGQAAAPADGEAPAAGGAAEGRWLPVLSNPAVEFHTREFGMLQLPVGAYRILWHGFSHEVTVKEGEIYRLPLGTVQPVGEDRPKARLSVERGESAGNPSLMLCSDGPTHVVAGDYWLSYAKELDVFPYEERVWLTQEVPASNDHGYARRLAGDSIGRHTLKGAGADPVPAPLSSMARPGSPRANKKADTASRDTFLGGEGGIDWETPP